ncbi:MAG: tRNA lysidine(34) synthetase TilS [Fimbriimonadaceae bacterium]|nr:tRNA lysidine(34) synthetase TilS [Fimbriimonadaceae bacterium]
MLERFREALSTQGLVPPGSRTLVGFSGGADSTCLVTLMHEAGLDIVGGHLHHGQRAEADDELARCETFCAERDIPFVSGRADVPRLAKETGVGLEEAGRNARYAFFRQAAFRLECDLIATAHTRDDHVETVLLNLARGTGLTGLGGIRSRHDGVVRPLLGFSREETRAFCQERGLPFHDDPANFDPSFSRARVRMRILPELRALNPAADEAIARLAEVASEEDAFLNAAAAAGLERGERRINGEFWFLTKDVEVVFDRTELVRLPEVLLKRGLRLATGVLGAPLDARQVAVIVAGLASGGRGSVTAEGGRIAVEWDADKVCARDTRPTQPFRHNLTLPGETVSEEFGWTLRAWYEEASAASLPQDRQEAALDAGAVIGAPFFRSAQDGETFHAVGRPDARNLHDLLAGARLTSAARKRVPIVCDLRGPLWAPGVGVAERARVKPDTVRRLRLSLVANDAPTR